MKNNIARVVGALFIIGTLSGVLSVVFAGSLLTAPNYLVKISTNHHLMIGAFFVLIMGLSLSMIPILMYPIFKRFNQSLALGAVVFRSALEMVAYIAIIISWFLLLTLSEEYIKAGSPENASYFQTFGILLLKSNEQIGALLNIIFSLGSLMIYSLFYQSKLIPHCLSLWGFIASILYLIEGLLQMFNIDAGILLIPLALLEIVLALWLIIKGFNPSLIKK